MNGFMTRLNREERREVPKGERPACEKAPAKTQLAQNRVRIIDTEI